MGIWQIRHEGFVMDRELFEREKRYQTMMAIFRGMQKSGILTEADLAVAEKYLREKYQPVFVAF